MKWIIKFFEWLEDIFGDGVDEILFSEGGTSSDREWQEVDAMLDRLIDTQKAEIIFAEIDNDLINQIEKADKDFKQAQLRHIPCQILYYDKHIVKLQIKKIKSFLIKGFLNEGYSIGLENGGYYHSGSFHDNKHYIKYKGK